MKHNFHSRLTCLFSVSHVASLELSPILFIQQILNEESGDIDMFKIDSTAHLLEFSHLSLN